MPDADYSFKVGSMPEARTYGQLIAHIAQAQFGQCSGLTGVPNPMAGKNLEQELKTKAELTKALADSFALCDKAFADVTDANATEMVKAGHERADARGVALRRHRARQRDRRHRLRVSAHQGARAAVDRAAQMAAADGETSESEFRIRSRNVVRRAASAARPFFDFMIAYYVSI